MLYVQILPKGWSPDEIAGAAKPPEVTLDLTGAAIRYKDGRVVMDKRYEGDVKCLRANTNYLIKVFQVEMEKYTTEYATGDWASNSGAKHVWSQVNSDSSPYPLQLQLRMNPTGDAIVIDRLVLHINPPPLSDRDKALAV